MATPFIHGSVNNIGKYFSIAKDKSPSILFFDEISGLLPNRETITSGDSFKEEEVNEFLIQLNDASENRILVVGATNFIERLDKAAIRPGRFDKNFCRFTRY